VVEELCGFLDFSHSMGMLSASNTAGKSAQPALSSMDQGKFHCWSVRVGEGSDILTQHCYSAAALLLATKVVSIVAEATVALEASCWQQLVGPSRGCLFAKSIKHKQKQPSKISAAMHTKSNENFYKLRMLQLCLSLQNKNK
jgi:hypothetical protein